MVDYVVLLPWFVVENRSQNAATGHQGKSPWQSHFLLDHINKILASPLLSIKLDIY